LRFTNAEELANPQAVHVKAIRGDVLADNSRLEVHGFQGLAINEQNLALLAGPRMSAAFKSVVGHGADFEKLLHRQMPLRRSEEILHP
jgi:hypothetical protein